MRKLRIYKKQIKTYTLIIILAAILGYASLLVFKKLNTKEIPDEEIHVVAESEYKEAMFTPEQMYKFIEEGSWPGQYEEEIKKIVINWYDYYSKETPYKTHFGEELNYKEYQKIHDEYYLSGDDNITLFRLLVVANKEWFHVTIN